VLNCLGLIDKLHSIGKTKNLYSTVSIGSKIPTGLIRFSEINNSYDASLIAVETTLESDNSFLPPGNAIWPL
jgi:hypothetical protein